MSDEPIEENIEDVGIVELTITDLYKIFGEKNEGVELTGHESSIK